MKETTVLVSIPQMLEPSVRKATFADPLENALTAAKAGRVSGGGTNFMQQTSQIDVSLQTLEAGLPSLRSLTTIKAPIGTRLHYKQGKRAHADELGESGWSIGLRI